MKKYKIFIIVLITLLVAIFSVAFYYNHMISPMSRESDKVIGERILFGTDYPICNPRMYVQALYGEDISDTDREKIFFENAMRILKIAGSR